MRQFILPIIFGIGLILAPGICAESPLTPQKAPNLFLTNGFDLSRIKINSQSLSLNFGEGHAVDEEILEEYRALKQDSLTKKTSKFQWALRRLDTGDVVAKSRDAHRNFYGASVTKVFVAGAYLNQKVDRVSKRDIVALAKMIAVSDNEAWKNIQLRLGDGNHQDGMRAVQNFLFDLGIKKTQGYRGWLGKVHGNETNSLDLTMFLHRTYVGDYEGAMDMWVLLKTCRTGSSKGAYYLPKSLELGGKTGTYSGPTVHPLKKKSYYAAVHHHLMSFSWQGKPYGLSVLTDRGRDSDVAILTAGLLEEYLKVPLLKRPVGDRVE